MMTIFGNTPQIIPMGYLEKFINTCHYGNWKRGDFIGHHAMGWGILWLDDENKIHVKRSIDKIWKSDWRALAKIKSKCIILHARFCLPWKTRIEDVHPITIDKKDFLFHNGIIDIKSFPKIKDPDLRKISDNTTMDTRKYLVSIKDEIFKKNPSGNKNSSENEVISALKTLLPKLNLTPSANSIFLRDNKLYISEFMTQNPIFKTQNYVLNINRFSNSTNNDKENSYCVSVIPFKSNFKSIPNKSCISYNFSTNKLKFHEL